MPALEPDLASVNLHVYPIIEHVNMEDGTLSKLYKRNTYDYIPYYLLSIFSLSTIIKKTASSPWLGWRAVTWII